GLDGEAEVGVEVGIDTSGGVDRTGVRRVVLGAGSQTGDLDDLRAVAEDVCDLTGAVNRASGDDDAHDAGLASALHDATLSVETDRDDLVEIGAVEVGSDASAGHSDGGLRLVDTSHDDSCFLVLEGLPAERRVLGLETSS